MGLRRKKDGPRRVTKADDQMTLIEHLVELRQRIVKSLLALFAGMAVVFLFYNQVQDWLIGPYRDVCADHPKWSCTPGFLLTDPLGGFATRMRISGYVGFIIALPVILWQVWRFIVPGLKATEKKYAIPFILSSVVLFLLGAATAWWTWPKALEFLVNFSGGKITVGFTPDKYASLLLLMMIAFGFSYLFPIFLVFLQLVNVLSPRKLNGFRRYAVVLIFIFAAVITPSGDPFSLIAMAVPMWLFYELSILIGWLVTRSKAKARAAAEATSSA